MDQPMSNILEMVEITNLEILEDVVENIIHFSDSVGMNIVRQEVSPVLTGTVINLGNLQPKLVNI